MKAGSLIIGLAAVTAAGLLAGCSSGNSASAPAGTQQAGAAVAISTRQLSGVGTVLTDHSGRTLYTPQQEASGVIKCTAGCLSFWFPVTVGNGVTPRAASTLTGTLSSIQRPDGGRQLTYNGQPLYTFKLDDAAGQAHGDNFTDNFGGQSFTWHAATVGASAPSQPASPSGANPYQGGPAGY
jgi:predicted lipoprotein with Yx(FWY)xxD motif